MNKKLLPQIISDLNSIVDDLKFILLNASAETSAETSAEYTSAETSAEYTSAESSAEYTSAETSSEGFFLKFLRGLVGKIRPSKQ